MREVRVLQFITPAGFYGAERWVLALANNLVHERVICDLAVPRESNAQDLSVAEHYPAEAGEVHYLAMRGRFDFSVVEQLVEVIRQRQIQIIHTHGYKSDIIGLLAAKRAGIRSVSTPHGYPSKVGLKMAAFIRIGAYILRYFDAVAPLSEELCADMRRFGVPASKNRFIRNGVDLKEIDEFRRPGSEPAEHDTPCKTVGFVGQMIPRKGLPDLLEAFDRLYQGDDTLKLQLLGDGVQRRDLEAQAHHLASGHAIEFLGFRSDRLELMARFDLFVMTSSLEGIPRCMMEAMALGVPVVAYDIPGVDQLIEHGVTGLLAPLGDTAALASCCQQLLDSPDLTGKLSEQARKRIDEEYSAARMAREYERLFGELLSQGETDTTVQKRVP
ncbi:Glycosyltransferase involved in cell wall bisynthesis [Marinobacter daqiaonensis]|uniref:Glycosyltransferase involved in cell wall bisynthesis n=1 Tax=Marinobacter daqiaonensis TaxID=650891 RepID=A0A1I6HWI5_9GAMM|nr:glycosyltransferase family 4 protein [Marinobacter daqiaonensis]SFR58794.1 Glycosyltransferase involved in cell wall bisynthesis [Marinobacter daqiaonensis]